MPEYVTLVDEHDNVIGSKNRSEISESDRYRIVCVWVKNSKDEILLAKRVSTKKIDPGKWGPAAAGGIDHPESYESAAKHELEEEIGIRDIKLDFRGVIVYDASFGKRACGCFIAKLDKPITEFKKQDDEVERLQWISEKELIRDCEKYPDKYVRNFKLFIDHFREGK